MRKRIVAVVAALVLLPCVSLVASGASSSTPANSAAPEGQDTPNAVVIALLGDASYSENGAPFVALTETEVYVMAKARPVQSLSVQKTTRFILNQGAVVRTGADSHVDIFLRRTGITVRLQPNTEVKFEKMARDMKDGMPVMETILAVREGSIFTVARSLVPGSTFEIRNTAGRAVVEGGEGNGRYIVTADGTHVTEKGSAVPLKVIGETGITVIGPGMKYSVKQGKVLPVETSEAEKFLIDFDQLDSLADQAFSSEPITK